MVKSQEELIVSIQCMVYNHEPYLRQCLDGFVMQKTNFKFEAIVHDDVSTDGSATIIREYAEKYPDIIKPIFEQENQYSKKDGSIDRIMNNASHGKYIAFCEGDDYWTDPYKLQKQVDFLENHIEYSMCFHKAKIINELGIDIPLKTQYIENRDYNANELFCNWIVPTASMVLKREVINYPYKKQERMLNGDINIVLTCATLGKIRAFNDAMSVYRIQSTGVTYNKKLQKQRVLKYPDHFLYLKDNFSTILSQNIINKSISQAYFRRIFVQETISYKIKDLLFSFYYHPTFATKGLLQYIKNKFKQYEANKKRMD